MVLLVEERTSTVCASRRLAAREQSFTSHYRLVLGHGQYLRLHGLNLAAHLLVFNPQHFNCLALLLG